MGPPITEIRNGAPGSPGFENRVLAKTPGPGDPVDLYYQSSHGQLKLTGSILCLNRNSKLGQN